MCPSQLFQAREREAKARHASGDDAKLAKSGAVDGATGVEGETKDPSQHPKVGTQCF